MGQQQLLLVILVVIIVGITTIVAVNVLEIGASNSNEDAVRQDLIKAASHAQEIWERPELLGGAGKNFNNMQTADLLERFNFPGDIENNQTINENATYSIESVDSTSVLLRGVPSRSNQSIETYVCYSSVRDSWLIVTDSPTAEKPDDCD